MPLLTDRHVSDDLKKIDGCRMFTPPRRGRVDMSCLEHAHAHAMFRRRPRMCIVPGSDADDAKSNQREDTRASSQNRLDMSVSSFFLLAQLTLQPLLFLFSIFKDLGNGETGRCLIVHRRVRVSIFCLIVGRL
jgi:hypothetical protein